MIESSITFRKKDGVEATQLGDDYVVLDPSGKVIRGLNVTAAKIWELTDGQRTAADISDRLAIEYNIPRENILTDVISLSHELTKCGLFERLR